MGSNDRSVGWNVFDTVKFIPSAPEAPMAEINAAIAALEYAQVTARLGPEFVRGDSSVRGSGSVYDAIIAEEAYELGGSLVRGSSSVYDAVIAEEVYQLGCAALSEGKVDVEIESLNISVKMS